MKFILLLFTSLVFFAINTSAKEEFIDNVSTFAIPDTTVSKETYEVTVFVKFEDDVLIVRNYTIKFTYKDVEKKNLTYVEYKGYTELGMREGVTAMPLGWRAGIDYIRYVFSDYQVLSAKRVKE